MTDKKELIEMMEKLGHHIHEDELNIIHQAVADSDLNRPIPVASFERTRNEKVESFKDVLKDMESLHEAFENAAQVVELNKPQKGEHIFIPQKAVPDNHKQIAEITKVIKSKTFVPITGGRPRVKPQKYEGLNDYLDRCNNNIPVSSDTKKDAIENISKISKLLLQQTEAGHIGYIVPPVEKSLRQQFQEKMAQVKKQISDTKSKVFYSAVARAEKILRVKRV